MAAVVDSLSPVRMHLQGVRWETYEALLEDLADQHVRMVYDRGELEIVSPSSRHERLAEFLGRLTADCALENDVPVASFGSVTTRRRALERGLEPDKCWYVAHEPQVRGRDDVDFESGPPPDLAIELDLSSHVVDELAVYAALGVPEVWSYDGGAIRVLILQGDDYEESLQSLSFPDLPLDELSAFVDRRRRTDENTVVREFRQWARDRRSADE